METTTIANKAEIKVAMSGLGISHWTDDLLDEIELNRRLDISIMQAEKGIKKPVDEVINKILKGLE